MQNISVCPGEWPLGGKKEDLREKVYKKIYMEKI